MITQQNPAAGLGSYTPEEIHAIVRRAHMERAQALREILAWLFTRHKQPAESAKRPARFDAVACS